MADSAGQIALDLVVNRKKFDSQMSGLKNIAAKAGKALAVAFSVKKIADFGKECIDLGSDLAEVQNVVDVTFTSMSGKVDKFAKSAATSFGMSETMAKKYTGTFGAMAKSFGFTESQAYDMSTSLTGLAGDVASFYDMSQDEAYTKLKSVFTGETESLKDLGVVMTQTALDSYAMANGFGKTTAKMSEQEKVALRYKFVQDQLSAASGDFMRTQDSWANQTRILSLQMDSLKANIGQGLINVLSPVLVYINKLIAKFAKLSEVFSDFTARLTGKKNPVQTAATSMTEVADNAQTASDNVEQIGSSAKKAAKEAEKSLMGFDQMNKISDSGSESDDTGSGSKGGSTGGSGSAGVVNAGAIVQSPALDKTYAGLDKIKKKFDEVKGAFVKGFTLSVGSVPGNLKLIKDGLGSIYKSLMTIAGNKKLQSAMSDCVTAWAKYIGAMTGMIVSVGTAIVANLVTGISNSLDKKKGIITLRLTKFFDITADMDNIGADLYNAVSDILSYAFTSKQAIGITTSLCDIFIESFSAAAVVIQGLARDLTLIIAGPIIENKGLIKKTITNVLSPVNIALKGISNAISGVASTLVSVYEKKIHPAAVNIKDGMSATFKVYMETYNKYVAPVMKLLAKKFKDLWENHIGPCFQEIIKAIGNVVLIASKLYKKVFAPIAQTIAKVLMPVLSGLAYILGTIIIGVIRKVVDRVKLVFKVFNDLCDGTLLDNISAYFGKIFKAISVVVNAVISVFSKVFGTAFSVIKSVFSAKKIKKHFSGVVSKIHSVFAKIGSWFSDKFKKAWEGIKKAFSKTKEFFSGIRDKIKAPFAKIHTFFSDKFKKAWELIKNAFSRVKDFFDKVKEKIKTPFTTIHTFFRDKFVAAWNFIKHPFSSAKDFFDKVREKVKKPFEAIHTWFKDKFGAAWGFIRSSFSFDSVTNFFKKVWDKIKSPFQAVAKWFHDTFSAAWQKVKDVFSTGGKIFDGIKDGIADTFKLVVNKIIDGINTVIAVPFNAINGMLNGIRNKGIAGAHPFTDLWDENPLKVPQIPKLAQGGYVKANTPQLAMIGDNRHQGEVVAPEDKLLEMAKTAAMMSGSSDTGEIIELLRQILYVLEHLNIDVNLVGELRNLFKAMQKESANYSLRTGKKAF